MGAEIVIGFAYAGFLVVAAWGLESAAAAAHRRADPHRAEGFIYRAEIEAFECRGGALLPVVEVDHQAGTRRHRAPEERCAACSFKNVCTEQEPARDLVRPLHPWVESEVGRFHRGISLTLLTLALLVLLVVALKFAATPLEIITLGGATLVAMVRGLFIVHSMRSPGSTG